MIEKVKYVEGDRIPVLKPLKGGPWGGYVSLISCQYLFNKEINKPTLILDIAFANIGNGDLRIKLGNPFNRNDGKIVAPAKQIIKRNDGTFREVNAGVFIQHKERILTETHIHWLCKGLASLELINKDGQVLSASNKEGYCTADNFLYMKMPDIPETGPQFDHIACEQKTIVGLTAGWGDSYDSGTEKQYISIDEVPTGKYWIRFAINKTDLTYNYTQPELMEITIDKENQSVTGPELLP